MSENITVFLAFGAGLLSFFSACILPLIPSYLCVIGGAPIAADSKQEAASQFRPRLVAGTASFILGFSAVFIVLSILLATTFSLMGGVSRYINIVSGAIIIVLGLNIIFNFIPFLNYEKRFQLTSRLGGIFGAFLMGAAFGAGWTPCIGPLLTSILLLAAQSTQGEPGGISRAIMYLFFYSAGLGLPFLLASLFFNFFMKASAKIRKFFPVIRKVSGTLLAIIGLLIITGRYQALSAATFAWQGEFASSIAAPGNMETRDNAVPEEVIRAFQNARMPVAAAGIESIDFTLPLIDGTNISLSDFYGKVVFLNFWATWCPSCRREMPSMESLYQKLRDRGFVILAVNLGESRDTVADFMRENALSFPAALDERGFAGAMYGVQAIPTTFIINRQGFIVSRVIGALDWEAPQIIAAFESLL